MGFPGHMMIRLWLSLGEQNYFRLRFLSIFKYEGSQIEGVVTDNSLGSGVLVFFEKNTNTHAQATPASRHPKKTDLGIYHGCPGSWAIGNYKHVCLFFHLGMEFCGNLCLEYLMVRVNGVRKSFMFVATSIKCKGLALAMPKHLLPFFLLGVSHSKLEIRLVVVVLWFLLVLFCLTVREEPHTIRSTWEFVLLVTGMLCLSNDPMVVALCGKWILLCQRTFLLPNQCWVCKFQCRVCSSLTPRYFIPCKWGIVTGTLFIVQLLFTLFHLVCPKVMCLHLLGLNSSLSVCCKASLAQQRARLSESEKFLIHPQTHAFSLVAYPVWKNWSTRSLQENEIAFPTCV